MTTRSATVIFILGITFCNSQTNFSKLFSNCKINDINFDNCMKDALNNARVYFKTGVPEYNIIPFDPFFASSVSQRRGLPFLNYELKLINVTESGWSVSEVINFRSDFKKNSIKYTQTFPDKHLNGQYEFRGNMLGSTINRKGNWNLSLYDLVQTTTITRRPKRFNDNTLTTPLQVKVDVQTIRNMNLHISNLLGGRTVFVENLLDRIINSTWEPGFVVMRSLINDLVSTAFTDIFNKVFSNFPFEEIIK